MTTSSKHPLRRLLITAAIALALIVAGTLFYDIPPPDESAFLPDAVLPPVPDHENGALLIDGLVVPFAGLSSDERADFSALTDPGAAGWDAERIATLLADNQNAIATLEKALDLGNWRPADPNFNHPFSEYQSLAHLKRFAALNAYATGDPGAGFRHLEDLRRFVEQTAAMDGALIGFLISVTFDTLRHRTITSITPLIDDPAHGRQLIAALVAHPPDPQHWPLALRSELTFSLRMINQLGPTAPNVLGQSWWEQLLFKPNLTLKQLIEVYDESAANALAPDFASRSTSTATPFGGFPANWTDYINPNFGGQLSLAQTLDSVVEIESRHWQRRLLHTKNLALLALHLHQLDHENQLPPSLTDLVPAYLPDLPTDPYDGAPLRYDPARRLLWSAGQNVTDDGGHLDPSDPHFIDWTNPTFPIPAPVSRPAPPPKRPPAQQ